VFLISKIRLNSRNICPIARRDTEIGTNAGLIKEIKVAIAAIKSLLVTSFTK
jgi:hypothetical protein